MKRVFIVTGVLVCILIAAWWARRQFFTQEVDYHEVTEASRVGGLVDGVPPDWIQATSTATGIESSRVRVTSATVGNALVYNLSYNTSGVSFDDLVEFWKTYLSKHGYQIMQQFLTGEDKKFYATQDKKTLFIEIKSLAAQYAHVTVSARISQ